MEISLIQKIKCFLSGLSMKNKIKDKMYGCLYGQAIGDALGVGSEFMSKQDVIRNYPDGLKNYDQIQRWIKGAWTDDTDMMLCILDGFDNGEFNLDRIASNFKEWFNSEPWGIGSYTHKVLGMSDYIEQPQVCARRLWDMSGQQNAANGALMRTSVIGITQNNIIKQTEDICKLTHYDPRCIGSCVIATSIINNLVWHNRQLSRDEINDVAQKYDDRIIDWVNAAYNNADISMLGLDEASSIGYTLRTLSAALWCYWHASSFENGLLSVVNEGGDADTNAAIACAILGAKFGLSSIPRYYIDNLNGEVIYNQIVTSFIDKILPGHLSGLTASDMRASGRDHNSV